MILSEAWTMVDVPLINFMREGERGDEVSHYQYYVTTV